MKKIIFGIFCVLLTSYSFAQSNFSVRINPKIEAVSIYWTLATADTLDTKPTPSIYYKDVKEYFKKCNNDKSLNWYRNLERWDGYDVASIGLFLSKDYPFKLATKPNINYIRSSSTQSFINHFNNFYKNCNVKQFIDSHKKLYNRVCQNTEDSIRKSGILKDVTQFFGYTPKDTLIIFIDLLNNLGNNAIITDSPLLKNKRFIKLAYLSDDTTQLTGSSPIVFHPYLNVIAHEYTHTFVNDFIPQYYDSLYKIRNIFLTTTDGTVLPDEEWKNELDELIVRTCVAKILEIRDGKEKGQKEIDKQAIHFALAKKLYKFMDNYVYNRNKYGAFEAFYPKLLSFFQTIAEK